MTTKAESGKRICMFAWCQREITGPIRWVCGETLIPFEFCSLGCHAATHKNLGFPKAETEE